MEFLNHLDSTRERLSALWSQRPPEVVSRCPDIVEDGGDRERFYIAVGKSVDKAVKLLRWTLKRFGRRREICILHVHQPSPVIPTLLGKLPAGQASAKVVSAFRLKEREHINKILNSYLSICSRAKVKASIVMTEADQVHEEIVELINVHNIRKLVMGAVPKNCLKVKKGSSKAEYAAKNAPSYCEIWFINKGKHVWTREASPFSSRFCPADAPVAESLMSRSLHTWNGNLLFHTGSSRSLSNISLREPRMELPSSPALSSSGSVFLSNCDQSPYKFASIGSGYAFAERNESPTPDLDVVEENLSSQLREARVEAEMLQEKAFAELSNCNKTEVEALEAISKVKFFECAHAHEAKLRKEAEDALIMTPQEQEKLFEVKEEATRELQKTMRNIALLDSRTHEANRKCDQAAGELKLIQESIATLQQEKQRLQRQKVEAVRWLERWRSRKQNGATANCSGFVEDLPESPEFSLADLQSATCDFSESFKLGQGGFGCVYKGEMLGRTVAIKKLHSHSMQGRSEFQQEVRVLSKLQHPHLVTLLGACSEAWSLVYEYLPNGSLKDCLSRKNNISPLTWNVRTRIAAEVSSALCFLHSSKPEKIVHGDLKPENILLDSNFSCKICDFGICRFLNDETLNFPSFSHTGSIPRGAFPYTDPEFHRTRVLTPKSDIYSFGLIILQLLTGKPPFGLVNVVRKAVSCGKLNSILDTSAGDWPKFVSRRLVDLGLECCELYSRDRPDLTPTLVRELKQLHVAKERPVPSIFLCPILQEIMHDPLVASDGFTYEGEAIRSWLRDGHETSPMTNLKLSHLHLIPNHAVRLAIQDWLCRS